MPFRNHLALLCTLMPAVLTPAQSPAKQALSVPAGKLKIGHDQLSSIHWSRHLLETPSDEGQFELLLDRSAAQPQVLAPNCRQPWLLLRMPGLLYSSPNFAQAVAARKKQFADLMAASKLGTTIRLDVTANGYGHLNSQGKLQLTGCNLWLASPQAP